MRSSETDAVAFLRDNEIPELSLLRVPPAQVARAFERYRHPHWPTDFD